MGRTNPTYRDWLRRTEEDCLPFRRALRQQYQADFDRLFEHADQHADAAGYTNRTDPQFALVLSILLGQERGIRELRERLAVVDDRLSMVEDPRPPAASDDGV